MSERGTRVLHTPLDGPLGIFLLGALGGLFVSYDRALGVPMLATLVGGTGLYYLCFWISRTPHGAKQLAAVLMVCALGVAGYFVAQYGHLGFPAKSDRLRVLGEALASRIPRIGAWRPHPNNVASFLGGILPLGLVGLVSSRRRPSRFFWLASTLCVAAAFLLTVSRSAWFGFSVATVLGAGAYFHRWRLAVGILAAGAIIVVIVWFALGSGSDPTSESIEGPLVSALVGLPDRLSLHRRSFYLVQDFLFTGIGLGPAYAMIYSRYVLLIRHPFLGYSHNLWLEAWLEQGIIGVLGLLWLVTGFYRVVARTLRKQRVPSPSFYGAWTGVTATLLHGLFDAAQYVAPWAFLSFFALLGLAVGSVGPLARPTSGKAWFRTIAPAAVVCLVLLSVGLAFRWRLAGLVYVNRGALRQARADLTETMSETRRQELIALAKADYERALAFDPWNRSAHQRLGVLDTADGRYADAVDRLDTALRIDPRNETTRKALGLAYMWTGDLDSAEPLLVGVPGIVEELHAWGWWRYSRGEGALAKNAYKMSLRLDPSHDGIRQFLAELP